MENVRKRRLFIVIKRKRHVLSHKPTLIIVAVSEFWRIAKSPVPLSFPNASKQGGGRFDDPHHIVPVLYCADSLDTCVYEVIDQLGMQKHEKATKIFGKKSISTSLEESRDTHRDIEIETRARRIPPEFYQRCAVHARFIKNPAMLLDLTSVGNRTALQQTSRIAQALKVLGLKELDVHAITTPERRLTQTITSELLRGQLASDCMQGIYSISRRNGYIYALFGSTDILSDCEVLKKTERFSPNDAVIRKIAVELAIKP